jgi:hypothetical protein
MGPHRGGCYRQVVAIQKAVISSGLTVDYYASARVGLFCGMRAKRMKLDTALRRDSQNFLSQIRKIFRNFRPLHLVTLETKSVSFEAVIIWLIFITVLIRH